MGFSRQAAEGYIDMGLDAIPLNPLSKSALLSGWQKMEPALQWESAPDEANIGLRCDGERALCVIDSDDKKRPTWNNVVNFLWDFGLEPGSYPVITTPNGGRHVYLSLAGSLEGDYRTLNTDFGAGEFRYGSGALVVAPPSMIPEGVYTLAEGGLNNLPRIQVNDILPILTNRALSAKREPEKTCKPSRRALALLRGEEIENYQTRSEVEQAILASLANSSFDFAGVLELFLQYPAAGKFRELYEKNAKSALRWLKGSYQKALDFVTVNEPPARQDAYSLLQWARSHAWPGRTGSSDRAVYLAHLSIVIRVAKLTYQAGSRELAEIAGLSRQTTEKANHRLRIAGLLSLDTQGVAQFAHCYRLLLHPLPTLLIHCERVDKLCNITGHDVFRMAGLGKAAGEVYAALLEKPLQGVKELAERTGRNRVTVWRALNRMSRLVDCDTGELVCMVETEGETWRALPVDLDQVARILGTAGVLQRQKTLHARERAAHRRGLELGGESK